MGVEIEIKAWADDYEAVKRALAECARFEFEYVKEDDYWFPAPEYKNKLPQSGVRIRRETVKDSSGGTKEFILVTYKLKERRGEIEVNDEHEFAVGGCGENNGDALLAFKDLLRILGLEHGYYKKKNGFSYRYDDITAELSFVEHLGWFVELENIAQSDSAAIVAAIREKLFALLKKIGIGDEKIENKYYSELLREKGFV